MAVVESLIKGSDGLVRSVNIRTKNGATNRPVSKLYPLELSEDVSNATRLVGGQEDCTTAPMGLTTKGNV